MRILISCCVLSLLLFPAEKINAQKSKQPRVLSAEEARMVKKDAASCFNVGDYEGALQQYKQLVAKDPKNAEYNYRLGFCYLETSINKKASLEYLITANEAPDAKKEWKFYLGLAYMY